VAEDFFGKQVEVIAFTLSENNNELHTKKQPSFTALQLNTIGYKFNRDEANNR
jgi:hypothetical protein